MSVCTCVTHSNSAAWQSPAVKEQHEKVETIHQGKSVEFQGTVTISHMFNLTQNHLIQKAVC